jgi:hypothetical protein
MILMPEKTLTKQHSLAKEEKFIQKFNDQDFFYILTVAKKNSDLKLYILTKKEICKKNQFEQHYFFIKQILHRRTCMMP